jgi:hypothetical protein
MSALPNPELLFKKNQKDFFIIFPKSDLYYVETLENIGK